MVLFGQRDQRVSVEGVWSGLVNVVASDGGCGGARPVENVPPSMVRQSLHRTNIYRRGRHVNAKRSSTLKERTNGDLLYTFTFFKVLHTTKSKKDFKPCIKHKR